MWILPPARVLGLSQLNSVYNPLFHAIHNLIHRHLSRKILSKPAPGTELPATCGHHKAKVLSSIEFAEACWSVARETQMGTPVGQREGRQYPT
jgi:hypothetical protein